MKNLLIFLLLLVASSPTTAQKWAALGTTWTYTFMNQVDYPHETKPVQWKAIDTITRKGHICTIIQRQGYPVNTWDMMNTMITYEDSDKVYWYVPDSAFFTVLYDFTKKVGESWEIKGLKSRIGSPTACPINLKVISIGIDTINGIPLKSMVTEGSGYGGGSFNGKIVQHIGHYIRPRPSNQRACSTLTSDIVDYFGLRCIDHPSIGFYDFKLAPSCDYVPTSINEYTESNKVKIYPNPSNGNITITCGGIEPSTVIAAKVYDLLGRLVYQSPLQFTHHSAQVNLGLGGGNYLLELLTGGDKVQRIHMVIQ